MVAERTNAVKVFYCYARKDKKLRDELERHLGTLRRLGQITGWYDREIQAGTEWEKEIERQLDAASIILLLISPDFIHSDYCYTTEMQRALELHRAGRARVIPIILRPVDWQGTPIAQLQVLPSGGKPVISWHSRDEAFSDVAQGLRRVVETLSPQILRPTNDLFKIEILELETFFYSRTIELDFCVVNASNKHMSLTNLSVDVLEIEPLEHYSVTKPGALFEPRRYSVILNPSTGKYKITHDRFMYKPNERDDFRLLISSEPGWKYLAQISAMYLDIMSKQKETICSEQISLEFPKE